MTTLHLTAEDPLFFRDGKPFGLAEEAVANNVFPPFPSVVQGAIRTHWFSHSLDKLHHAATSEDPTLALQIKGIFLTYKGQRLYPFPATLVLQEDAATEQKAPAYLTLTSVANAGFISDEELTTYCFQYSSPEKTVGTSSYYLLETGFVKFMNGESFEAFDYIDTSTLIQREPKTGIGRNALGAVEEGLLYQISQTRLLENIGFQILTDGLPLQQEVGRLRLGGESRSVFYQQQQNLSPDLPSLTAVKPGHTYGLYLLTPAIFDSFEGWLLKLRIEEIEVLTYATARPVLIGGFDLKNTRPKPMRRAVPAGSVVVVRPTTTKAAQTLLDEVARPQGIPEYTRQGFGIVFLVQINESR